MILSLQDVGYFFLRAFSAALVTLPPASFLVTSLMTPTATVCFMSRTAKRPRGAYCEKASTHMGFWGMSSIMAASPDLTTWGSSSRTLPSRLSILVRILAHLQAMWEVWQSQTGAYPFLIPPG